VTLPWRLDCAGAIVSTHVRDSLLRRDAVEYGKAGQRRARATATATTSDLDALVGCPLIRLDERSPCVGTVTR
jgi:hypothetical protein